jgi:hypothetical protein
MMKRREIIKAVPLAAMVPAGLSLPGGSARAEAASAVGAATAETPSAAGQEGLHQLLTKKPGTPDYIDHLPPKETDMDGLGPDGKPVPGYRAAGTGSTPKITSHDPSKAPHQMQLTPEEQDIMDGKQGEVLAKVMKTVVRHGNLFGATKLVDLGGNPHSSTFIGTPALKPIIELFAQCADAGLKAYAPYTINPRPFDLYGVHTDQEQELMIFESLPLQTDLDHVHARLGARGMDIRSCMCYLPEVGNRPEPGTFVAWGESSAINAGNSILGIRTNRNSMGMELLCALLGKAPYFGLMTDEGRKAKWLIEVKTSKEPDWGTLGGAIGEKCVEDVPYITGIDKYLDGEITPQNIHKLKAMGAATASSGAVGLYHVENLTPDAKQKGRALLAEGYQTYVIDDAELERIRSAFPNLWPKGLNKPTNANIGCPHNTHQELVNWGTRITEELDKRGLEKVAVPTQMFQSRVVSDHFLTTHPEMYAKLFDAGVRFSNTCTVCYGGFSGYADDHFNVTNSNKCRKYTNARYISDDDMIEVLMTGEIPA